MDNLLDKAGIQSKAELGRRLGLNKNTIGKWGAYPPQYATAYLELLIEHEALKDALRRLAE